MSTLPCPPPVPPVLSFSHLLDRFLEDTALSPIEGLALALEYAGNFLDAWSRWDQGTEDGVLVKQSAAHALNAAEVLRIVVEKKMPPHTVGAVGGAEARTEQERDSGPSLSHLATLGMVDDGAEP